MDEPLNTTVLVPAVNIPLLVKLLFIVIVLEPADNVAPKDILSTPFMVTLVAEPRLSPPVLLTVKLLKVVEAEPAMVPPPKKLTVPIPAENVPLLVKLPLLVILSV